MRISSERGSVAVISLCAMVAVLWLGISLCALTDYGEKGSAVFIEETRLRLVAEGRVERLAGEIEKNVSMLDGIPRDTWEYWGGDFCQDNVQVKVYLQHASDGTGGENVYLKAFAEPEKGSGYEQGKIVCGYLHRRGDECDWRGWRPVGD